MSSRSYLSKSSTKTSTVRTYLGSLFKMQTIAAEYPQGQVRDAPNGVVVSTNKTETCIRDGIEAVVVVDLLAQSKQELCTEKASFETGLRPLS